MTDEVQLIKQELERIEQILDDFNKTHNNTIDNGIVSAKKNICKQIKSFIDSLPEEPASEDLEEEIENYTKDSLAIKFPTTDKEQIKADIRYIARHFAEWQKQQMIKNAVDATVLDIDAQTIEFGLYPEKLLSIKEGDKVKIIIIKEE